MAKLTTDKTIANTKKDQINNVGFFNAINNPNVNYQAPTGGKSTLQGGKSYLQGAMPMPYATATDLGINPKPSVDNKPVSVLSSSNGQNIVTEKMNKMDQMQGTPVGTTAGQNGLLQNVNPQQMQNVQNNQNNNQNPTQTQNSASSGTQTATDTSASSNSSMLTGDQGSQSFNYSPMEQMIVQGTQEAYDNYMKMKDPNRPLTGEEQLVQQSFDRVIQETKKSQEAQKQLSIMAGLRSGRYQYAGDTQAYQMNELVTNQVNQLNDLEIQKQAKMAEAKAAAENGAYDKFLKSFQLVENINKDKLAQQQALTDNLIKIEQLNRQKAADARESVKFQMDMQDRLNQPFQNLSPEINTTLLGYLQDYPDAQVTPDMTALEAIQAIQQSPSWQSKQAKENRQPGDLGDFLYLKNASEDVQQGYMEFSKYMANLKAKSSGSSGSSELANAIRMQTLQNSQLEGQKKMEDLNLGFDQSGNIVNLPGLSAKEQTLFDRNKDVQAVKGYAELMTAVKDYETALQKKGTELFGSATGGGKELASARDRMTAQIGNLDKLGVLQPADLKRLEGSVASPFGFKATFQSKDSFLKQLDELKKNVQNQAQGKIDSLKYQQPKFAENLTPESTRIFGEQNREQNNQDNKYDIKY